ncbi:Clathrin adaptor alpha/beta/gamma-adaptin appendage Ig-like subdomain-containing protein [Dioscorea alata]|uniref:Clathrin adaptor alpha/beta/gamma-adaptin appendage Ig-like subdomain-containing protein n=1 Tax=Dioscorea alata TaxID=55571 RepID=A0ACB7UYE2_DIOAL|nr:Clathrin adaptor alpha/beta/gamma-adaptin appendage Ig-like subdomain-containing protein [Dioscorea alata]
MAKVNGTVDKIDAQPVPYADLLGDLLGPLAIEGPPGTTPSEEQNPISGYEAAPNSADALALSTLTEESDAVQPIGNVADRFHALCLKDSGVLHEDPYIQIGLKAEWRAHHGRLVLFLGNKNTSPLVSVRALILPPAHLKMELSMVPETIPPRAQVQCPLEVINLRASRDVAVLDFSYKFGTIAVNIKLRLPAVLNKFLQPISVSAEEFFPQWKSLSGPPLKLQEVVRGVKPMPIPELANLFTNLQLGVTPGLNLSPYEKKKYVWKMLYIYMLGYDVDFGHMEAISLISAPKYPEKQVGYIVTSSLLNENHDFLMMVINTVRNDIIGRNETFQCLALTMVGNIGGREFAESLAPDVHRLLISSSCRPLVRKKAGLCLLRLYRKNADVVNIDGWSDRMAQLLDEGDLGVLTSVMSLFALIAQGYAETPEIFSLER